MSESWIFHGCLTKKGEPLIAKLIMSLSLGFVVLGARADSLDGRSLQAPTLDAEDIPTYAQFLIPNSSLRVLIDPEQGTVSAPQAMQDEPVDDHTLSRSVSIAGGQDPTIVKLPDGTISLALDKRHLKYHSISRCTDPEQKDCTGKDEGSPH